MNFNNSQGHLLTDQVEPKRQWWLFVPLTLVLALILLASMFIILTPVVGAEPAGSPAVSWASATYTVTEGTNPLTVTVVLTPTSLMTVTVDVQDTAGTATPTVDYEPVSQTLTLLPEQVTYTLPITIFDNSEVTGNRSFMLVLSNPGQATLGEIMTTTITIMEDDEVITPTYQAFLPAVYQTVDALNESWSNQFYGAGTDDAVWATAVDAEDNLYIGGDFNHVNQVKANHIAKWNGTTWEAIGSGLADPVVNIAVAPNGNIYAVAGRTTYQVYEWNGTSWRVISPAMSIKAKVVVDSQNKVYLAGSLVIDGNQVHISHWNGTNWSALGGGVNDIVHDLVLDENDNLYISGEFTQAGLVPASRLAKWDGFQWVALTAPTGRIEHLALDGQNNLVAITDPEMWHYNVDRWNGISWETKAVIDDDSLIYDLQVNSAGTIYVAAYTEQGSLFQITDEATTYLGSSPTHVFDAVGYYSFYSNFIYSLVLDSQDNLYTGGKFQNLDHSPVTNIAKRVNNEWQSLGERGLGVSGQVNAIVVADNGDVYVGGMFIYAGSTEVNHIAKWDGEMWSALDEGVDGTVHALALDSQGNLYVGGDFAEASGTPAAYLAQWDGQSWSGLGNFDAPIHALVVDSQANLYVGGEFTTAGVAGSERIARWNGTTWSSLDGGVSTGAVYALAVDNQDKIYVGGSFYLVGDSITVPQIALWDGQNWSELGGNGSSGTPTPAIYDIVVAENGDVFVAGRFNYLLPEPSQIEEFAYHVARWDGTEWHSVDFGVSGYHFNTVAYALAQDGQGNIYIGGHFLEADDTPAPYLARWDGDNWQPLGSNIRQSVNDYYFDIFSRFGVYALAADGNGNLYVGGNFLGAGNKAAESFSIWQTGE